MPSVRVLSTLCRPGGGRSVSSRDGTGEACDALWGRALRLFARAAVAFFAAVTKCWQGRGLDTQSSGQVKPGRFNCAKQTLRYRGQSVPRCFRELQVSFSQSSQTLRAGELRRFASTKAKTTPHSSDVVCASDHAGCGAVCCTMVLSQSCDG